MLGPPHWSVEQLAVDAERATEVFRRERLEEPLEDYLEAFDTFQGQIEELLETTVDLSSLNDPAKAVDVLATATGMHICRYLMGPPISEDDLKTVAQVKSMVASQLRRNTESVARICEVIRTGLDRRRFAWLGEEREATEPEKTTAVMATAALMATSHVGTNRRTEGKRKLEGLTEGALAGIGFNKVPTRRIFTVADAPEPGQFCGEAMLGDRKADFIARLWDNRIAAIECKASNSSTNSVKRLNNDAAAKAEVWRKDFGATQVVTIAVLSGVFKTHNLESAQDRGLTLFWGHDLAALTSWINQTKA